MTDCACRLASIMALLLTLCRAGPLLAQPPANDECVHAAPLTLGLAVSGDTYEATGPDVSPCGFSDTGDVWFRFVPPQAGVYRFATCTTPGDTVLSLHDGCPLGDDSRAIPGLCADDGCDMGTGGGSRLFAPLSAGGEYLVRIGGFAGNGAAFTLTVERVMDPPFNDECDTPGDWENLGTQRFRLGGASTGASQPEDAEACGTVFNDAWYMWTAPEGGVLTVTPLTFAATGFITRLAAYPGAACSGSSLGSPLACGGFGGPLSLNVQAGARYLFRVGSASPGHAVTGDVSLSIAPAIGACCLPGGCEARTRFSCGASGGYFSGDGSVCAAPGAEPMVISNENGGVIPDASAAGISRSIVFGAAVDAARIRVRVTVAHPYMGDLDVSLIRGGRTVRLLSHPCGAAQGFDLWFDDAAPPLSCAGLFAHEARPAEPLSQFLGESSFGLWTLRVRDLAAQDVGSLVSWSLSILAADPESCGFVCRADFNGDGAVTVQDIYDYLAAFLQAGPGADFNGAGGVTVQDVYDFLTAWLTGCEGG